MTEQRIVWDSHRRVFALARAGGRKALHDSLFMAQLILAGGKCRI